MLFDATKIQNAITKASDNKKRAYITLSFFYIKKGGKKIKVIKRNGQEVLFDATKIQNAITKASDNTPQSTLTKEKINLITQEVTTKAKDLKDVPSVEVIQDFVEDALLNHKEYSVAKNYIKYRYDRFLARKQNTTDSKILSLIDGINEEVKQENSNKNPTVNSVQRDYMAGEVSRDITNRYLLPKDIVKAHEEGIIHFHDADYFAQHMYNCSLVNLEDMLQNGTVISGTLIEKPHSFSTACNIATQIIAQVASNQYGCSLVNLEDMLQNGTVISGTLIEKPHSFSTACNIATQIIAQVASNQYGGQSISLAHLAPFVQISREKIKKEVEKEQELLIHKLSENERNKVVESRLKIEINRGVQMIQYQILTLLTTNGQAPFITIFMYLDEAKNEQEKADLAMLIEEVLNQRIQGVKNEKGVWITPAFPKLIYVLEEDNITENSKYWYLTELAAKCTAKRMVPDYISEKKMKELKGDVYTCMGK